MAGGLERHYDIHHADRSATLLTGGESRRMGFDKGSMILGGEPLAARLARLLREAGWEPTLLGQAPLEGFDFQADFETFAGPLSALRRFVPTSDLIFVLSCDVPLFHSEILEIFAKCLGGKQAVVPSLEGRLQPLCGLYRREAWAKLSKIQSSRIMDWVGALELEILSETDLRNAGGHPDWCKGVNTPSELSDLLDSHKWVTD